MLNLAVCARTRSTPTNPCPYIFRPLPDYLLSSKDNTWIRAKVCEDIFNDGLVGVDLVLAQAARFSNKSKSFEANI